MFSLFLTYIFLISLRLLVKGFPKVLGKTYFNLNN